MKDIQELKRRKADLIGNARKYDEECTKDSRAMTGEEQGTYQKMVDEICSLGLEITREEKLQKEEMENAPEGDAGFRNAPGVKTDEGKTETRVFASLGDQLKAVARAHTPGGQIDPRLTRAVGDISGMSEMVDSEGGFLVEKDHITGLLKGVYDNSQLASRCLKVPIGAGKNGIRFKYIDESSRADGSRSGGVRAYWEDEADAPTATNPKLGRGELSLVDLKALCYATDDLLEDSEALEGWLKPQFFEEMAFKLQDGIVNGDGVGKPLGVLNSDALVSISGETSQTTDTICTENILKMWKSMPAASRGNAIWLYNQELEDQLETLSYAIGTAGVLTKLFTPNANGGGSIKGRPAIPIEQCAGPGDAGTMICMDPSKYLLIDKNGMRADSSIHVRFLYNETTFRFLYRCNGQPIRSSKITPYKRTSGSFYISPYVTVAAI